MCRGSHGPHQVVSQDLRRVRQARIEMWIWQQLTDARKCLQVPVRGMLETAAKKIKIVKPRDNVMVPVPDLGRAKIDAHSLRHPEGV